VLPPPNVDEPPDPKVELLPLPKVELAEVFEPVEDGPRSPSN
jgi:hypothetical protein